MATLKGSRVVFFFKQKTAYEIEYGLEGSEMCIRDRICSNMEAIAADEARLLAVIKTAVVAFGNGAPPVAAGDLARRGVHPAARPPAAQPPPRTPAAQEGTAPGWAPRGLNPKHN